MKAIYMVCTRRNPDFTLTRIATDRADNADVLGNVTCIIQHNVSMIIWPKKKSSTSMLRSLFRRLKRSHGT